MTQHHHKNEVNVLTLSWPVTHGVAFLGAMEHGDSLGHQRLNIPGSNTMSTVEPGSQDSGNVSGWPGTVPQVPGGRNAHFQNQSPDSSYCAHVSTIKRRS